MKSKPGKTPVSKPFEDLKKLIIDTMKHVEREPVFAAWLRHEAKGHNFLAECVVLHGMSMEDAWDFVRKSCGNTKAEAYRRRLKESMDLFAAAKK